MPADEAGLTGAYRNSRGEITLVLSARGDDRSPEASDALAELVQRHLAAGDSARETARQLGELGYSKRSAYQLALELARRGGI